MPTSEDGFTADQAARANTVLRSSLGLPPERFQIEQFVGMISEEVELLRASGRTDVEIAQLLRNGAGIEVAPEAIARYYAPPEERGRPA